MKAKRDPYSVVRNFLHRAPDEALLPGPTKLVAVFEDFRIQLPKIAARMDHEIDEVQPLSSYRVFLSCVTEYLKAVG